MKVYRARAWRGGPVHFDPLDCASSVAGPKGWRYNDLSTEILYTAEVEALAILELAVRPGWETIQQVLVATIEIPEGSIASLADLGIVLPSNWNARPAADDSRLIAREFLDAAEAQAIQLGATKESQQPSPERSRVLRDPAGHPFCLRA